MQQITFEEALKNIGEKVTKTAFNRLKSNNMLLKKLILGKQLMKSLMLM